MLISTRPELKVGGLSVCEKEMNTMFLRNAPRWIIFNVTLLALASMPSLLGAQTNQDYIVRYRPGATKSKRAASVQKAGGQLRFNYDIIDAVAIRVRNNNALANLQRDEDVLSIDPDYAVYAVQG